MSVPPEAALGICDKSLPILRSLFTPKTPKKPWHGRAGVGTPINNADAAAMEALMNLGWICSTGEQGETVGCGTEGRAVENFCPWLETETTDMREELGKYKMQLWSF